MKNLALSIAAIILVTNMYAQFYNGHQMSFGKNRVQHQLIYWNYARYPKYDLYFSAKDPQLAYKVAYYTDEAIAKMERFFDYRLKDRLVFIIYNSLDQYKQSNFGYSSSSAGVTFDLDAKVIDNKVFIYSEGQNSKLQLQVNKAIAQVFITQMLRGKAFSKRATTPAQNDLPAWFEKGLILYAADQHNFEAINYVQTSIKNKKFVNLAHLEAPKDIEFYGFSFWKYIAETYGEDVIANILYFSRLNKNLNSTFYFVLGEKFKTLNKNWFEHVKQQSQQIQAATQEPPESTLKKYKRQTLYYSPDYCSKTNKLAYATNKLGKIKIYILDLNTGKKKKIYKHGYKLYDKLPDDSYPLLQWTANGQKLYYITKEKGKFFIAEYQTATHKTFRTYIGLELVNSLDISQNGRYIIISGQKNGRTDLFLFNTRRYTLKQLTTDLYDELYPAFCDKDKKIVFSSDRISDTLHRQYRPIRPDSLAPSLDLYKMRIRKPITAQRLTNTIFVNELQAFSPKKDTYVYTTDSTGVENIALLKKDSVIAFIDTAVHYTYFDIKYPITNYSTPVKSYKFHTKLSAFNFNQPPNYTVSTEKLLLDSNTQIINSFKPTQEKILQLNEKQRQYLLEKEKARKAYIQKRKTDSVLAIIKNYKPKVRNTIVDINNYTFEIERDSVLNTYFKYQAKQHFDALNKKNYGTPIIYHPVFYISSFSSNFDYGQYIQTYQPYNGGPFVFGQGFDLFTTVELTETVGDYRLLGGVKVGNDLRSMEYIAALDILRTKLDKQIILHRITRFSEQNQYTLNYYTAKNVTNEAVFSVKYPFNRVAALKLTSLVRFDKYIYMATDYNTLIKPSVYNLYTSAKAQFIFDNTRKLADNLYDGLRFNIFTEAYWQINNNRYWTGNSGFDLRFYQQIFRKSIIALRLAGAKSYGTGKIVYYLGSVDNWYILIPEQDMQTDMFDYTVNINTDQNYLFQAVATPLRGYKQNIRNGNTFVLANAEVRLPIVRMLLNKPISSKFWNNFQVIGFADAGAAWCGLSPMDKCNAYNTYTVENPPIRVDIDLERPPVVGGIGFGFRTYVLGYFVRLDYAWGIEGNYMHPRKTYLSLSFDF